MLTSVTHICPAAGNPSRESRPAGGGLIPKIALAPLFIVRLGISSRSRLAFSLLVSIFPLVIATATGLTNVPADMVRLCRSLTASEWQIFVSVRFPCALPHIFRGMKIAITFSIIGVVVGEFLTAQAGFGHLMLFASSVAETGPILAAITVLCASGWCCSGWSAWTSGWCFGASDRTPGDDARRRGVTRTGGAGRRGCRCARSRCR
jgi:ABC-type nitrate/sulfonate/bicarbonate transport system permease component